MNQTFTVTAVAAAAATFTYSTGTKTETITPDATDVYTVDGVTSNQASFKAQVGVGDVVTVQKDTPATGRQTITLTNRTPASYTSGGISVDTNNNALSIIEPFTRVALRTITYNSALTTYTVDGSSASLSAFVSNLNEGDEISVSGAGTQSSPFVLALTNRTISGTVATLANPDFAMRTIAGGTATADITITITAADNAVTVNGQAVAAVNNVIKFFADARVGDTVSFGKVAGKQTISLTQVAPAAIVATVGPELDGLKAGTGELRYLVGDAAPADSAEALESTNYTLTVNGVAASEAAFKAALTAGDSVTILEADGAVRTKGSINLVNGPLSGTIEALAGGPPLLTFTLKLNKNAGSVTAAINFTTAAADSLYGNDDASRAFFVNGATATQAAFVTELNLVDEGAKSGSMTITDNASVTEYRLVTVVATTAPAMASVAAITGASANTVVVTFSRPVVYTSAFAAGDWVVTNATGATVVALPITGAAPIAPAGRLVGMTLSFATPTFADKDILSVTLTAAGAAKIKDGAGVPVAVGTVTSEANI